MGEEQDFGLDVSCDEKPFSYKFRNLCILSAHKNPVVAELYENSEGNYCWKLDFVRGFNDWEVEDVTSLYSKLESQKLRENIEDALIWKLASSRNFSVRCCCNLINFTGEDVINLWEKIIPLRVRFFVWEAYWEEY